MSRRAWSAPADAAGLDRAVRELGAFLLLEGVAPSHRLRASSALAHLVHAVCDAVDALELEARLEGEDELFVSLALPHGTLLPADDAVLEALCDGLEHTPDGQRLRFTLPPALFDEERVGLSERDYLTTDEMGELVTQLCGAAHEAPLVPEVLTPTVGRLLASSSLSPSASSWS